MKILKKLIMAGALSAIAFSGTASAFSVNAGSYFIRDSGAMNTQFSIHAENTGAPNDATGHYGLHSVSSGGGTNFQSQVTVNCMRMEEDGGSIYVITDAFKDKGSQTHWVITLSDGSIYSEKHDGEGDFTSGVMEIDSATKKILRRNNFRTGNENCIEKVIADNPGTLTAAKLDMCKLPVNWIAPRPCTDSLADFLAQDSVNRGLVNVNSVKFKD